MLQIGEKILPTKNLVKNIKREFITCLYLTRCHSVYLNRGFLEMKVWNKLKQDIKYLFKVFTVLSFVLNVLRLLEFDGGLEANDLGS